MRSLCTLVCTLLFLSFASPTTSLAYPPHVEYARSYLGTIEVGDNRGPAVEMWQRAVHIPAGSPWCAAFVSAGLEYGHPISPTLRSGSARAFISSQSISARCILRGERQLRPGYLVIFGLGSTFKGHIEDLEIVQGRNAFLCIGGNTSCHRAGDPRNGGEVCENVRSIQPRARFRVTHFTPVIYPGDSAISVRGMPRRLVAARRYARVVSAA